MTKRNLFTLDQVNEVLHYHDVVLNDSPDSIDRLQVTKNYALSFIENSTSPFVEEARWRVKRASDEMLLASAMSVFAPATEVGMTHG